MIKIAVGDTAKFTALFYDFDQVTPVIPTAVAARVKSQDLATTITMISGITPTENQAIAYYTPSAVGSYVFEWEAAISGKVSVKREFFTVVQVV